MSEYMPKVGDRVRATLGENVLVGTWGVGGGGLCNRIVLDICHVIGQEWDGWQFEQIVELPSSPWALVGHPTDSGYIPYLRDRKGNWHEIGDDGRSLPVDEGTVRHYLGRGFTVWFEGVDE